MLHPTAAVVTLLCRCKDSSTLRCFAFAQEVQQPITVSNPGPASAVIDWSSSDAAVTVQPQHAVLMPNGQQQMDVLIKGLRVGKLKATLTCCVQHGTSQVIELTAVVRGESLTVSISNVRLSHPK